MKSFGWSIAAALALSLIAVILTHKRGSPEAARPLLFSAQPPTTARLLADPHSVPAAALQPLAAHASKLSAAELADLSHTAISPEAPGNARSLAVFLLARAQPSLALPLLQKIVLAPIPAMPKGPEASAGTSFEVSLRLRALEAIDGQTTRADPAAAALAIHAVLKGTKTPTLRYFARASEDGLAHGHPGQMHALMDQILQEAAR